MPGGAKAKRSGFEAERKVKKLFEAFGWKVVRSGGSLGTTDLACFKSGKVLLVQVKRRTKRRRYRSERIEIEGFEVHTVVDFGGGDFRIDKSGEVISNKSMPLKEFLAKLEN
ncbi:MAG: type II toxin-antitoxin system HicA family toxin [Candidatus Bathyarchaeia archaeon]